MRELPILFSGPMVRAILDRRKTQTRRPIRRPKRVSDLEFNDAMAKARDRCWPGAMKRGPEDGIEWAIGCPFGQPGDRLWVRETHAIAPETAYRHSTGVEQRINPAEPYYAAIYREGWNRAPPGRWRPSIHMPKWAARTWLEVEQVRVQRVQDITEEDARAEGVEPAPFCKSGRPAGMEHVEAFEDIWTATYGADAWERNDWVWVVGFRVASDMKREVG